MTQRFLNCPATFVLAGVMTCAAGLYSLPVVGGADGADAPVPLTVKQTAKPAGWMVTQGDRLFAGYLLDSNGKPIIYPLVGPGGHRMTRDFPMKDAGPSERNDHDHHRSFWLTHGDVNGVDFWLDDEHCGKIVHRKGSTKTKDDGSVVITTQNDWNAPDGKRLLSDVRRYTFVVSEGRRIIDCDFLLIASDGDVNFGDTKEGSFGLRLAGTMKVDSKNGGLVTNAEGLHDKAAWGKKSAWVNYSGPVRGDMVGVTVHDHPESFNYPCRWHVRTYGLFAANPFGVHHFIGGPKTDGIVLKDGDQMRLSYRVVIEQGALDADRTVEDSKQYASSARENLR
ncbi:PmoA family protein [bacterium]|nr:PmoA family protein [bacterium]